MTTLLVLIGVFVATLSLCVGAYLYVNRDQLAAAQTARERLRTVMNFARIDTRSILRDDSASELELLNKLLSGKAITTRIARTISDAGLDIKPGTFFLAVPICGVTAMLVAGTFGIGGAPLWLILGGAAPFIWLRRKRKERRAAFEEQLPEAIDMLMSALRAGYSFQAATKFIGEELPAPLGREFAQFYDEQRLGVDVRTALLSLQDRVPSTDLKMFVTAVLIQRETGGNLTEVLGNIAEVMRERADIHRKIDSLTAESKMSARFLSLLPVIVFVLMLVFDPNFVHPMIATPIGLMLLIFAGLSVGIGYFIMMRIATIDV
ncbi:MAG TPA: type II secretion system F family protein [Gemmatimonadaceae bacterium]|nr:type II secretion system F family protein [Gemmatimonadaceae bacterium]